MNRIKVRDSLDVGYLTGLAEVNKRVVNAVKCA